MARLSERLAELRKARGLNQRDLASALHVSPGAVGLWETGERFPSPELLQRLADFFGVSIDYLVGRIDDPGRPANDSTTPNTALPDCFRKLPPDMQKFVEEESKHGWPYLRLAQGLKMKDLSPAEFEAIVETWMDAKRRYEREFGKKEK